MTAKHVIIIYEAPAKSWNRDVLFLVMVGVGCFFGIPSLVWVGAVLFFLILMSQGSSRSIKSYKTPQEAADMLKAKFGVVAMSENGSGSV